MFRTMLLIIVFLFIVFLAISKGNENEEDHEVRTIVSNRAGHEVVEFAFDLTEDIEKPYYHVHVSTDWVSITCNKGIEAISQKDRDVIIVRCENE